MGFPSVFCDFMPHKNPTNRYCICPHITHERTATWNGNYAKTAKQNHFILRNVIRIIFPFGLTFVLPSSVNPG